MPAELVHSEEPQPYVRAPDPIPVQVAVDGQVWPGLVLGWRGDRVDVQYRTGVGMNRLRFVPAAGVQRVEP